MKIFISAGEASGDAYGAALATEMRRLAPDEPLEFLGVGGRRMDAAGVRLVARSDTWGAISILESLKVAPRAYVGYWTAKFRLRAGPPGVAVPIDFGYFNIRFARAAKRAGWRVLYFVPPGSWNRKRQGKDMPLLTDAISTPFSWSAELLREMGANAHWFGHPIRQLIGANPPGVSGDGLGILPGSRNHEIDQNLPLIATVVQRLDVPSVEFGLAPSLDVASFIARWNRLAPNRTQDRFTQGDTVGVFRRAHVAIVCSGTATLEAALCRCPMVVVYRFSKRTLAEAKILRVKRPKFIALPNIVLDRSVVPELLQDEATPESVTAALRELIEEGEPRRRQLAAFEEIEAALGPSDAVTRTAELALSLIRPGGIR